MYILYMINDFMIYILNMVVTMHFDLIHLIISIKKDQ